MYRPSSSFQTLVPSPLMKPICHYIGQIWHEDYCHTLARVYCSTNSPLAVVFNATIRNTCRYTCRYQFFNNIKQLGGRLYGGLLRWTYVNFFPKPNAWDANWVTALETWGWNCCAPQSGCIHLSSRYAEVTRSSHQNFKISGSGTASHHAIEWWSRCFIDWRIRRVPT